MFNKSMYLCRIYKEVCLLWGLFLILASKLFQFQLSFFSEMKEKTKYECVLIAVGGRGTYSSPEVIRVTLSSFFKW